MVQLTYSFQFHQKHPSRASITSIHHKNPSEASIIESCNNMSVAQVFRRAVTRIPRNMAPHCVKTSTFRPLGSIRIIQHRSNMAKSISNTATAYPVIPTVEVQHESEIPSEYVLSRLNIFDLCHEELESRETDYRMSSDQWRDAGEVRRQQALGESLKKNEGGPVTQFLVRERGWKNRVGKKCSEQEEHGTMIGSEVGEGGGSADVRRRHDGDGEQRRV